MTTKINIAKMRDHLKAAQATATSSARAIRGAATMATDPESHALNIATALWYSGQAIAFQTIESRYQHIINKNGFDIWHDLLELGTTAQLQADAAQTLGNTATTEVLKGMAEAYQNIADNISDNKWEEDNQ